MLPGHLLQNAMFLPPNDQARCYFHLGFGTGAGIDVLVGQLEKAFKAIRNRTHAGYIHEILNRCDDAFTQCYPGGIQIGRTEVISGDINRSIQQTSPITDWPQMWAIYLFQVDLLSQELRIDNLRRMDNPRYSHNFSGAEYLKVVPGPSDTAVGATMIEYQRTGGGLGVPIA